MKGRKYLGYLDDGRIILKWNINRMSWRGSG
jgi:hypothetical protein